MYTSNSTISYIVDCLCWLSNACFDQLIDFCTMCHLLCHCRMWYTCAMQIHMSDPSCHLQALAPLSSVHKLWRKVQYLVNEGILFFGLYSTSPVLPQVVHTVQYVDCQAVVIGQHLDINAYQGASPPCAGTMEQARHGSNLQAWEVYGHYASVSQCERKSTTIRLL